MSQGHQLIILSIIAVVFLMILSTCNSYPLFNEFQILERPAKFHTSNDADRYVNRIKQYYETMDQLRHWRRDIDQSNEDDYETLQDMLRQYKNLEDKR